MYSITVQDLQSLTEKKLDCDYFTSIAEFDDIFMKYVVYKCLCGLLESLTAI